MLFISNATVLRYSAASKNAPREQAVDENLRDSSLGTFFLDEGGHNWGDVGPGLGFQLPRMKPKSSKEVVRDFIPEILHWLWYQCVVGGRMVRRGCASKMCSKSWTHSNRCHRRHSTLTYFDPLQPSALYLALVLSKLHKRPKSSQKAELSCKLVVVVAVASVHCALPGRPERISHQDLQSSPAAP